MDYTKIIENIRYELKTYITENNIKSLVIGVSGGIDSALCVALARPVCDELKIKLIGLGLHTHKNKDDEMTRSQLIGETFCTEFHSYDITEIYKRNLDFILNRTYDSSLKNKIRCGNIAARLRMMILYDKAQVENGIVLSTDNYTEYLLGFWTIHGDVGDYGMIQNLWKTEVYDIAISLMDSYIIENNLKRYAMALCVDAKPTDGLGVSDSDFDQLGANSYQEIDNILKKYLFDKDPVLKGHPVIERHLKSEFKRNNPYNIPRHRIIKEKI